MAEGTWEKVCAADDLTTEEPHAVQWRDQAVCLYRVGAELFATSDICSHGSASLADGEIDGYEIECPFHGGRFDVRTGAATRLPCRLPIQIYRIREADGAIWLSQEEHSLAGER